MLAQPDELPVLDGPIACASAVATFLLAADVDDPTCGGRLRRLDPPDLPLGREPVIVLLQSLIALAVGPVPFLHGPDADLLLAVAAGGGVLLAGAIELADQQLRRDAAIASTLEQRVLVIDNLSSMETREAGQLAGWLADLPRPLLLGQGPRDLGALAGLAISEVRIPAPSHEERIAAWRAGLGEIEGIAQVAALHRLPVARIEDSIRDVLATVATTGEPPDAADVADSARRVSAARLGETAQRIDGDLGWTDLVLPPRPMSLLRSLDSFMRHRDRVLGEWGYARRAGGSQGMVALFTGESGTGKTMAALVVAHELGLELYRVDLSTMVSKGSARPSRTSIVSSMPPTDRARCCSSTRPTRCSASARRSATPATATRTSASPTSCSVSSSTTAPSSWRRTCSATSTRPSCGASAPSSSSRSPTPSTAGCCGSA